MTTVNIAIDVVSCGVGDGDGRGLFGYFLVTMIRVVHCIFLISPYTNLRNIKKDDI